MTGFVDTSVGSVYYTLEGKGKTIVLLHGFLESVEIWKRFYPLFVNNYQVLSIDLPGHGQSALLGDYCSMESMAQALEEVLKSLDIDDVFVIGHSMGGYVSLAFAEAFPTRIKGLVLLNSHPYADSPEKAESRSVDILRIEKGFFDEIVEVSIPRLFANHNLQKYQNEVLESAAIALKTPKRGVVAALRGMANRKDRNDVIKNLSVPVCLIFGRRDNLIPQEVAQKIISDHPNCLIVWLENSGHMGFVEERDQTAKAITSFLTA